MKTFIIQKLCVKKSAAALAKYVTICLLLLFTRSIPAVAQQVLFDFDNAPVYTPLPINLSQGGITAHLSATGQGYSIQNANVMGFTPQYFAGHCIYPSSIFLSDLLISFDHTITAFSIMYAAQELGCDDAALMRVTAKMNGVFVGSNIKTASNPGTWPTDILSCTFPQGFNSVVVHYDHRPPTCQDYGTIFMADNMTITPLNIPTTLIIKVFIEGFYNGDGTIRAIADPINHPFLCDTVTLSLHDIFYPYDVIYSVTGTIDIYGYGSFVFPGSTFGNNYYLAVQHRNALETWSKFPVSFSSSTVNYDFTSP